MDITPQRTANASAVLPQAHAALHLRRLAAIALGHALEWYDWGIYAVFAPFFAGQFFGSGDQAGALLKSFAVFAVGFVARPVGGIVLGALADRRGRRYTMTLAVAAMALASLALGVVPSYGRIGVIAPVVLVIARLIQGMACGGELPAAQTYLSEIAPAARRGRWSSLIYIASVFGNSVGIALGLGLTISLSDSQMHTWGWRVPFLVGAVFGIVTAFMRRVMAEPDVFVSAQAQRRPTPAVSTTIRRHYQRALQVIGLTVGLTVAYYAWVVATPSYAMTTLGLPSSRALSAAILAAVPFMLMMPFWGSLADRLGRRPVLLIGTLGGAVVQFPLQHLLGGSSVRLFLALVIAMVPLAAAVSILPAVYAELFPTGIRASGMAVPYSLTTAAFGGTAPYLQDWVSSHLSRSAFDGYVVVLLLVSAATVVSLPETRGRSLADDSSWWSPR
jgi:MHS family alpha-ketoglutarate permease-like MFS transporter